MRESPCLQQTNQISHLFLTREYSSAGYVTKCPPERDPAPQLPGEGDTKLPQTDPLSGSQLFLDKSVIQRSPWTYQGIRFRFAAGGERKNGQPGLPQAALVQNIHLRLRTQIENPRNQRETVQMSRENNL